MIAEPYTNEKQILKFYIRLLMYLKDEYSKNKDIEINTGPENYLKFVSNGVPLDETFVKLLAGKAETEAEAETEALKAEALKAEALKAAEALNADALEAQALQAAEALKPIDTKSAQVKETGQHFDLPFSKSKSTSSIEKPITFDKDKDKMINIIKTAQKFENIYDLLSKNSYAAQKQFIEDAFKVFTEKKWIESTVFTDADADILYTTATEAIDKTNATPKT